MRKFALIILSVYIVAESMIILNSCNKAYDPRLLEAEDLMESYPDSALSLLEHIQRSEISSESELQLYNLLLIHARYRNYLNEDNDTTISACSEYFLRMGNKKYAAEALYLSGFIQLDLDKIGESAVSLMKGMEIAKSIDDKFLEGQCARGLFLLHGKILDSSAQLHFAKKEYDSFSKGNHKEWIGWGRLDMATAYCNNGQYLNGFNEASSIIKDLTNKNDSLLIQNALTLIATTQIGLNKYSDAIKSYIEAYSINPETISDSDIANLKIAISRVDKTALSPELESIVDTILIDNKYQTPFEVLESENDYKEAYEMLKLYMNEQDTIIAKILHNNVSESINYYRESQEATKKVKHLKERYLLLMILFGLIALAACFIGILRRKIVREKLLKFKMEEDLENLRKDFGILLEKNKLISDTFRNSVREKYDEFDNLCDNYYEKRFSSKTSSKLSNQISDIVAEFNDTKFMGKVARDVDNYTDGLYSSFKEYFSDVKSETLNLYLYLMLGFGTRTISIIMDQDPTVIYNRKSRLKAKIRESNIDRKDEHLRLL